MTTTSKKNGNDNDGPVIHVKKAVNEGEHAAPRPKDEGRDSKKGK